MALVALCIAPTAVVTVGLAYGNYQLRRDRIYLDSVLLARRYAAEIDRELGAIESGMRVLASAPELVDDDLAAFHARARAAIGTQPIANYLLTDRQGHQRLNTLRPWGEPLPTTGTPPQLSRVFEAKAAVVTDLFVGPVTRAPVVAMGVPVFRGNEVVYSLNIGLPPARIERIFARHALPEGWVAAVLDSSGTVLARSREGSRFVGSKAVADVVHQIASGSEGSMETRNLEGEAVVSSFSRSTHGWSASVGAPKARLEAELAWLLLRVGAGTVFALLIGAWLAHRIAHRVSRAVVDLNQAALALVQGQPVRLPATQLVEAEAVGAALEQAAEIFERTRHLAYHDALTGLCNRPMFEEDFQRQLAAAQRSGQPLTLLAIDLDGFKAVNDLHGHAMGDRVLQAVAARIMKTVRAYDLAARVGGDEFLVLLPDVGPEHAQELADRLVDELSRPYDGSLPAVSASIGIATYPAAGTDAASLMACADRALYAAKSAGKGRASAHCGA